MIFRTPSTPAAITISLGIPFPCSLLRPLQLQPQPLHPLFVPPHLRQDIRRSIHAHHVIGYVSIRPRDFVEVVWVVLLEDFDC